MSQPISRVLSRAIISLGCLSPNTSSNLPGSDADNIVRSLFGLAPSGVYPANRVASVAVRSYRPFSPLPLESGGLFSVALSVDLRLPGVTWHCVLWSPDFPLFTEKERLPGRLKENYIVEEGYLAT